MSALGVTHQEADLLAELLSAKLAEEQEALAAVIALDKWEPPAVGGTRIARDAGALNRISVLRELIYKVETTRRSS